MKKTILVIVILSLLLSVCSCASSNSKETESLNQKISELEKQGESTAKSTAAASTVPIETSNQDGGTYLAAVQDAQSSLWGYIDQKGDYVFKPQFFHAHGFAVNGLACVKDAENYKLWGYIDKTGDYVIEPQFKSIVEFSKVN